MLSHMTDVESDIQLSDEELLALGKSLVSFLFTLKPEDFPENDFIAIATTCLNCLKFIAQIDTDFSTEHLGELIGITKAFILYSIPDISSQPPIKIASAQQAMMEPAPVRPNKRGNSMVVKSKRSKKGGKKKVEAKTDENQRSFGFQDTSFQLPSFAAYRTSDSDYSDNEHNREFINRHKQAKLRLSALSLLLVISGTVDQRILFGYWHSLFATEESNSATLLNCVLKDSSPRCKILALQTIIQLLKASKQFLIQAENKEKAPATFTPFSVTLGNMIVFAYEKLTQAMVKEGDLTVLTQILKCISIFIPATPFHRLKTGIVTGFVKYVRLLTRHKDPTIKVAALTIMGNLISIPDITPEIYELLEIPKSKIEFSWKKIDEGIRTIGSNQVDEDEIVDLEFEDEEEEEEAQLEESAKEEKIPVVKISWLLQTVLENLGVFNGVLKIPSPATSVRIESLQVLSAMTSHFLLLKDHLRSISIALVRSFKNTADDQLYACRALDSLGSSINIYLSADKKNLQDLDDSTAFWLTLMPSIVEKIQDSSQPANVRSSLADGLANIGVHVFEKLEHQKQILLISILTGCSYDEDGTVKSSAIRALAIFVLFPSLRDDLCFVENTIESILRIIKDPNVLTRAKASWSLGNAVDALLMTRETQTINERLLKQVYETSLEATADNDRVKVNAVRTIGNLLTLMKKEQLKDEAWVKTFEKCVQSLHNLLVKCANVKVKWNTCYSLTSLMKNSIFFDPSLKFKWQELVFPALCDTIRTSPNFKVRINACVAFTIPSRESFAGFFIDIWSCLLIALEQSNNLTDFNEYKHRDTLQDQLCTSICHLISIATIDDVVQMKNELFPLIDITKQNWNRVFNRWLPECQGKILSSVLSLKDLSSKTTEQKNSIEILVNCFQPIEQY